MDYGPQRGSGQRQQYDAAREQYGNSPWVGRGGQPLPYAGDTVSDRGYRAPFFTPDAGNPANAAYFKNQQSPEAAAAWEAQNAARNQSRQQAYAADPAISAARGAGDMRGYIAALQNSRQAGQEQRFIDQGGTAETYARRNDPNAGWPVPGSPSGNYQYGPGRPGPTPPGVAGGARGLGPLPPEMGGRGGLIEGYQPSAGSVTPGGRASFDAPGASTGQGSAQPYAGAALGGVMQRMMEAQYAQPYNPAAAGGLSGFMGQMQGGQMDPRMAQQMQMGALPTSQLLQMQMGGMGGGYGSPMMETQRSFPGGMNPVNPGPYGGRPVQPGYPTSPYPGSFPGSRLPGPPGSGYPAGPSMPAFEPGGYGGQLPMNALGGMQMFGYQPFGGGYQPQMQNQFAGMFGGGYY